MISKLRFLISITYFSVLNSGDSGGGHFLFDEATKKFNVAGIVSASVYDAFTFCNIQVSSIFTNVANFFDWIKEEMRATHVKQSTEVEFKCQKQNRKHVSSSSLFDPSNKLHL